MFNMTAFISTLIIVFCAVTICTGLAAFLFNRYWGAKLIGVLIAIVVSALLVSHITALLVS